MQNPKCNAMNVFLMVGKCEVCWKGGIGLGTPGMSFKNRIRTSLATVLKSVVKFLVTGFWKGFKLICHRQNLGTSAVWLTLANTWLLYCGLFAFQSLQESHEETSGAPAYLSHSPSCSKSR